MSIRFIILYEFKHGISAAQTTRNICSIFGSKAITERSVQRWFLKFRDKDFNLKNLPRVKNESKVSDNVLKDIMAKDPKQTTRQLATQLRVDQSTIVRRLRQIGMVRELNQWKKSTLTKVIS